MKLKLKAFEVAALPTYSVVDVLCIGVNVAALSKHWWALLNVVSILFLLALGWHRSKRFKVGIEAELKAAKTRLMLDFIREIDGTSGKPEAQA